MPRGDGTGPMGQGPGSGRGQGRMGGFGAGAGGSCVCTQCGAEVPHTRGNPCNRMQCPKCGALMIRQGYQK